MDWEVLRQRIQKLPEPYRSQGDEFLSEARATAERYPGSEEQILWELASAVQDLEHNRKAQGEGG